MKKWLCLALVWAMCCTSLVGDAAVAFAWEGEVVSEQAEAEVALADDAGDTGLTIELPDEALDAPEETAQEATEEAVEEVFEAEAPDEAADEADDGVTADYPYYARVLSATSLESGVELAEGDVVLATGPVEDGLVPYAFNTSFGVYEGKMSADVLERLDGDALFDYMTALSEVEGLVLYGDNIDYPLPEKAMDDAEPVDVSEKAAKLIVNQPELSIGVGETYKGLTVHAEGSDVVPEGTWSGTNKK